MAVSGMSAASENAMPGDALYGVKRSTERAQLALASSEVNRGQLFLDFATPTPALGMLPQYFLDVFRQFAVHWTPGDIPPSGALDAEAA